MAPATRQRSSSLIFMASERLSFAHFAGRRSTSGMAACTSIEQRVGSRAFTLYMGQSFEPCAHYRDRALTSSRLRLALRSQRRGSCGWFNEPDARRSSRSKFTPTCSATQPDTSSPTMATIHGRSPITSGIGICNQQRGILR